MNLPISLMNSLRDVKGFNEETFTRSHNTEKPVTSIRLNPSKKINTPDASPASIFPVASEKIVWSSDGYYLDERPSFTFDPFFHAGAYYVQEASSMFLEQVLKQAVGLREPIKILDLCAAPGGKSTLIQSLISPQSILVSNEVIRSRASILEENITKWGAANVIVSNSDPSSFKKLEEYFDVIVVDAPCSGSGLFRKDPNAVNEWSEDNVQLCSQRQQRILADIYPALKKDGVLIYATCSYSEEEDECISDWLLNSFAVNSLQILLQDEQGREFGDIVETYSKQHAAFGYRFFPDKVRGEGFFIACFRKLYGDEYRYRQPKKMKLEQASRSEQEIVRPWLRTDANIQLWKQGTLIFAFPAVLEKDLLAIVSSDVYIRKAGVSIGTIAGKELVPDHNLALSVLVNPELSTISLKKEEALQYLRKEEVKILSLQKGWALVQYEGMNLGWIKILSNRTNNYYPKEWRILKSGNQ